ncbi:hypothetical protein JA33_199 [Dickeya phage vB_DsoM_JA33]|uniref:Uncharacterized protein n=2 Tax=Salmondvirus JA11 TaxID=2734141 RepID=A0A386K639_9CAUD|nr:hypothetical protein HOU32_gp199 [Dickeya phage vB_DsoM_JA11]AXG67573.1 hypothetical protein JA33_199 [Dickeya phage vB_DsoM_JA33]AYD80004.1 hypothetical protein JA11_199 [Dickeya phage vB_DsoM_JA11]
MPKKKARTEKLPPGLGELLEIGRPEEAKVKLPKKINGVLLKPKPKPKAKKKSEIETPLRIYELAALYELYHRNTVTDSFRTWPDITIAEAQKLVAEKLQEPISFESAQQVASLYRNDSGLKFEELREFKNALIEKEIFIGMSIPLFIEFFKVKEDDPIIATFLYAWAAHVRTMIDRRKKQGKAPTRNPATVAEGDFCVEVECSMEQALVLERYCAASHETLIACRDYLKSFGNKAPKRIDLISSKLATKIRKEHGFEDVPRSLIVSALNGYTQKLKFNSDGEFSREKERFYLRDCFKLSDSTLTVGKAKEIAITKIVGGERHDLKVHGISFERISPLRYCVTVQYDKADFYEQKYAESFGTD